VRRKARSSAGQGIVVNLPPHIAAWLESETAAIRRRYRVDEATARAALLRRLRPVLQSEAPPADEDTAALARRRGFREAARHARRDVYYSLRRYQRGEAGPDDLVDRLRAAVAARDEAGTRRAVRAVLEAHASTRERLPDLEEFYRRLAALVPDRHTVLDLGCGVQPLALLDRPEWRPPSGSGTAVTDGMTPMSGTGGAPGTAGTGGTSHIDGAAGANGTAIYVAVDRSRGAVAALEALAPALRPLRLVPVRADVAALDWAQCPTLAGEKGQGPFDLGLLLKLVPVLARQQREVLPHLARVPARRLLVTGNCHALAHRRDIRRREEAVLRRFIDLTGRPILGSLETGDEFGYLLGSSPA